MLLPMLLPLSLIIFRHAADAMLISLLAASRFLSIIDALRHVYFTLMSPFSLIR